MEDEYLIKYRNLCKKFLNRSIKNIKKKDNFYQQHHIIPQKIFHEDNLTFKKLIKLDIDFSTVIYVTRKEHFELHDLLVEFSRNSKKFRKYLRGASCSRNRARADMNRSDEDMIKLHKKAVKCYKDFLNNLTELEKLNWFRISKGKEPLKSLDDYEKPCKYKYGHKLTDKEYSELMSKAILSKSSKEERSLRVSIGNIKRGLKKFLVNNPELSIDDYLTDDRIEIILKVYKSIKDFKKSIKDYLK